VPVDLRLLADGVENPANSERIAEATALLGGQLSESVYGRLIAVENTPTASSVYGRRPARAAVTLAVGNERRGVSRLLLAAAAETLVIPTLSRTVSTLNVAAAAAVAGWYVSRGSGGQARRSHPERRRPMVLISGADHVEVGSSLRSSAAFGYREVFLEDRGAGWFEGGHHQRREARAAARRHKNPLRVRRAPANLVARFDEVLVLSPGGPGVPINRARLTRGRSQLIVIGAPPETAESLAAKGAGTLTLGVQQPAASEHVLRLVASIALAEIARQVGLPAAKRAAASPRAVRYERELALAADGELLFIEHDELLAF
jgi:tRNA G18 (ribose-2'-O)-methylase SpoU